MADTICHATQGGLLLLAPFIGRIRKRVWIWVLAGVGGFFGALPDLLGVYGTFILHDRWKMYRSAHHGAIMEVMQYVPMYWLHLYTDRLTHGPGQRWWIPNERVWVEILSWSVNLLVIAGFYWIWTRRRAAAPGRLPEEAAHL